ncbi:hypothetical protein ACP4OV_001344 [Aristida adscensionis]
MSKASLLCALLLLQTCLAVRLPVAAASSRWPAGGQIGVVGSFPSQDPIRMLSRGHGELAGTAADSISDDGGSSAPSGEEEEGQLDLDDDGSGGTKDSSGDRGSGGDVECPECGKLFKNDKSMFGHLRSHPNRGYKGATPPVKKLKLSSDTEAASLAPPSPDIDRPPPAQRSHRDPRLTSFEILCACVMYTLRYRNSQAIQEAPPPPPSITGKEDEAIEHADSAGIGGLVTSNAGAELIKSSNAEPEFKSNSAAELKSNAAPELKSNASPELKGNSAAEFKSNAAPEPKSNAAAELKSNAGPELGISALADRQGGPAAEVPKKRRRNKPKEVIGEHRKEKAVPRIKEKRPYICKYCKSEFPTHQALGGHMAGHHRDKKVLVPNEKGTFRPYQGTVGQSHNGIQAEPSGEGWRGRLLPASRQLEAQQFSMALNMGWQSGQAPGGHRSQQLERMHGGSSSVAPPPTHHGDRRRPLNIDLNVEAPEQD